MKALPEGVFLFEGRREGPTFAVSYGVHGNERAPIEAGRALADDLLARRLALERGRLLLVFANPRAAAQDRRASEGGEDLNRCFHPERLAREPRLYEEERAREIVGVLEEFSPEGLVDFHCTVEPGRRFLMHHPPAEDEAHRRVAQWLSADVVLCDPDLRFGGVSLDEWMSTRGRVGICYETGWLGDPTNRPEDVRAEMENLLRGIGLLPGEARAYPDKRRLRLDDVVVCEEAGFRWAEGMGENLQEVGAGTELGMYPSGRRLVLERDAVLVFPKKRPELVEPGKPLVYLARRVG